MSGKDSCELRPKAATRSDILYLFGEGNLSFELSTTYIINSCIQF